MHTRDTALDLPGRSVSRRASAADPLPAIDAFWSITIYRRDTRPLVANAIDRYAIGDRTTGLEMDADGSLTIRIQHNEPPSESRAIWLPAPAGPVHLMMRLYHPRASAPTGPGCRP